MCSCKAAVKQQVFGITAAPSHCSSIFSRAWAATEELKQCYYFVNCCPSQKDESIRLIQLSDTSLAVDTRYLGQSLQRGTVTNLHSLQHAATQGFSEPGFSSQSPQQIYLSLIYLSLSETGIKLSCHLTAQLPPVVWKNAGSVCFLFSENPNELHRLGSPPARHGCAKAIPRDWQSLTPLSNTRVNFC